MLVHDSMFRTRRRPPRSFVQVKLPMTSPQSEAHISNASPSLGANCIKPSAPSPVISAHACLTRSITPSSKTGSALWGGNRMTRSRGRSSVVVLSPDAGSCSGGTDCSNCSRHNTSGWLSLLEVSRRACTALWRMLKPSDEVLRWDDDMMSGFLASAAVESNALFRKGESVSGPSVCQRMFLSNGITDNVGKYSNGCVITNPRGECLACLGRNQAYFDLWGSTLCRSSRQSCISVFLPRERAEDPHRL